VRGPHAYCGVMRRNVALLAAAVGIAFALPAEVGAQQTCNGPPGTAAIEQYCEWVPSASGDRRPGQGARPSAPLPPRAVNQLARAEDGRALLTALGVDPDAPSQRQGSASGGSDARGGGRGAAETGAPAARVPSNNPLDAVRSALGAGPIGGPALPWIIFVTTVVMGGWAWVSKRRRSS
jgi:hypothetical protein